MKKIFLLYITAFISLHLNSQNCSTHLTFINQDQINTWVNTHSNSRCNIINGNLNINGPNLDFSGLTFIDSIKGSLNIGNGTLMSVNLTGLTNLKSIKINCP